MLEIHGGWVILPNYISKDSSIVVNGNRIIDIGTTIEIRKKFKFSKSVGSKNAIVCPGFIDTHLHSPQIATIGLTSDKSLLDWLKKYIWKWEGQMTKEQARVCAELSYLELLRSGVTSFVDYTSVRHTEEAFKTAKKFGLRATIGKTMMDRNSPPELLENTEKSLKQTERLIKRWHGKENGRLRYAVTPRFGITCTDRLLKGGVALAKKYKTMITTHAHENKNEVKLDKKNYKKSAIKHFDEIGLLGKYTLLAHGIWLDDDEIRIIAKTGTSIAHCPGSNMMLASGCAPIQRMQQHGIRIGLGSDVGAYYNFSSFDQMRLSILLQKVQNLDPVAFDHKKAFELATIGGANAIGLGNEIGSLEKGKKADIVLLDGKHIVPENDLIAQIVYCAEPNWITDVVCDGKILVKDGKVLVANENKITANAKKILKIKK
ncbi:MAG: amidohydrolase family protein [Candidatus Micrarchaeota archaeon]